MFSYLLAIVRLMMFSLMVVGGLLVTSLLFPIVSWDKRRWVIKNWSMLLVRALGVRVVIKRPPPTQQLAGLLVSNHSSWIDIFATDSVHPVRFVAKSEIRDWPVLGTLVTLAGTMYVERGNRTKIDATNTAIATAIQSGDLVGVYPEGTTTDGTYLLPFKTNLLQPLVGQEMFVYPVAVMYQQNGVPTRLASYEGDTSFGQSLFQLVRARGIEAHIHFCEPLRGADYVDRVALTQAAQQVIAQVTGLTVVEPNPEQEALLQSARLNLGNHR